MKNQIFSQKNWTYEILDAIKKDLKSDHLRSDHQFYKTYFGNKPLQRLTAEEIFAAYEKELINGNESLADWIINRWVFKHGDIYQHFADRLSAISPEFDAIKTLTEKESEQILAGTENFGAVATYLFAGLNGVVFPASIMDRLRKRAEREQKNKKDQAEEEVAKQAEEKNVAALQREIARLHDKIAGVQKKYTTDTEALKKQIRILQKNG